MKHSCSCFKYGSYWRINTEYGVQFRIKKYKKYWLLSFRDLFNNDITKPIKLKTKRDCDEYIKNIWSVFYKNNSNKQNPQTTKED